MEKLRLLLSSLCLMLSLCSCMDTRITDMKGMTWKSDLFSIEATSEQLQNQWQELADKKDVVHYSSIVVNEKKYACTVGLENNSFYVVLYDAETNTSIDFYGQRNCFLEGNYERLVSEKNKDYQYSLKVTLINECQYYSYCQNFKLDFPESLTLYGYQE